MDLEKTMGLEIEIPSRVAIQEIGMELYETLLRVERHLRNTWPRVEAVVQIDTTHMLGFASHAGEWQLLYWEIGSSTHSALHELGSSELIAVAYSIEHLIPVLSEAAIARYERTKGAIAKVNAVMTALTEQKVGGK